MTARDVQVFLAGALAADCLIMAVWWVCTLSDRRKARREAAKAQAKAQAALDAVTARVSAIEARRHSDRREGAQP